MKREEVINTLRKFPIGLMDLGSKEKQDITEAIDMALAALRGPTREQVEKLRGKWIGDNDEAVETIDGSPLKSATCSVCGNWLVGSDEYDCRGHFCPDCGSPMTDEAVDIVMERLEGLYETE